MTRLMYGQNEERIEGTERPLEVHFMERICAPFFSLKVQNSERCKSLSSPIFRGKLRLYGPYDEVALGTI